MPCALAQQPLSYIPTARPLDHVGVTHDDQPIGRPGQPHVQPLPEALASSVFVQTPERRHGRSSSPVVRPRPSTGNRTGCRKRDRVQALVDVAATYLETLPGDPADDHTVVMVHVNAEALGVPAGTPRVTPNTFPRNVRRVGHLQRRGPRPNRACDRRRLAVCAECAGRAGGSRRQGAHPGAYEAFRDPAVTHGAKGPRQGHLPNSPAATRRPPHHRLVARRPY